MPTWETLPPAEIFADRAGKATVGARYASAVSATHFHVQLARDERFNDCVVDTRVDGKIVALEARGLAPGAYLARVSTIDDDDFEGAFSTVARFAVLAAKPEPAAAPWKPAPPSSRYSIVTRLSYDLPAHGVGLVSVRIKDNDGRPATGLTVLIRAADGAVIDAVRPSGDPGTYTAHVRWHVSLSELALEVEASDAREALSFSLPYEAAPLPRLPAGGCAGAPGAVR